MLAASNTDEFEVWENLCNSISNCDVYYYPQYALLYELYGEGKAICFYYVKNENEFVIYPAIVRKVNDLPEFSHLDEEYYDIITPYGYGGYLCFNFIDMKMFFTDLSDYFIKNNIISEFLRFHPYYSPIESYSKYLKISKWNQTVSIDLSLTESTIWQQEFSSTCRNRIRKAEKSGVTITEDDQFKDLNTFYKLYFQTMEYRNAIPFLYFNIEFFKNIKTLLNSNCILLHAKFEDQIIASALFLYNNHHVHYLFGASIPEYLKYAPINLLFYHVTLWAKTRDIKLFHLGGGLKADDSLFRFKKTFSNKTSNFYIGSKIHNETIYNELSEHHRIKLGMTRPEYYSNNFFPLYRLSNNK